MRWKSTYCTDWQKKFALFPVMIDEGIILWLESYEMRYVKEREKLVAMFGEGTRAVGFWQKRKGIR